MLKQIQSIAILVLLTVSVNSQSFPPKQAYPINVKQIHSGHSLTDPLFNPWPGQYVTLITDHLGGVFDNIAKSTIPGSPMFWRWEHEAGYGQPDARWDIADWELLIITESVPLGFTNHDSLLTLFTTNAWENGNNGEGAPTLLWTTWTHIDDADGNDSEYSGSFRELLDEFEPIWEKMADSATANLPSEAPPVYIIPGHKMMARLYDDIETGNVPGITDINQFFSDYIHLNNYGAYAMAMIHYACIFNSSPVGLTNDLGDGVIPQDLATYLQTMIWDVVTSYPRTGISTPTDIKQVHGEKDLDIYPNPVSNYLTVNLNNKKQNYFISDLVGKIVYSGNEYRINISHLKPGCYILSSGSTNKKIIKN